MNSGVNKGSFNNNGRLTCTSIVSSGRITCDEISVTTNGLTVNGSINCGVINAGPVLASSNIVGDPPFKVNNSASQEILSVNNNGKITCKGLSVKLQILQ